MHLRPNPRLISKYLAKIKEPPCTPARAPAQSDHIGQAVSQACILYPLYTPESRETEACVFEAAARDALVIMPLRMHSVGS